MEDQLDQLRSNLIWLVRKLKSGQFFLCDRDFIKELVIFTVTAIRV